LRRIFRCTQNGNLPAAALRLGRSPQRLFQIGNQIIGVFDADRNLRQAVVDGELALFAIQPQIFPKNGKFPEKALPKT
jgi:hypothetical protein